MGNLLSNYGMDDQQVIMVAGETNEMWLHPEGNKGWHTCLITSKKVRGQKAKDIIAKQEEQMKEIIAKIEQEDKHKDEMDQNYLESVVAEQEAEMENADMSAMLDNSKRMSDRLIAHIVTSQRKHKTVVIQCADCGKDREIKVQDKFQVKRCVECQKKYRNRRRAERRRQKRQEEKAQESK